MVTTHIQRTIRTQEDWPGLMHQIERLMNAGMPKPGLEFRVRDASSRRSISQNAISHAWYQQLADELKEYTAEGYKNLCKYRFGMPILCRDPEVAEKFSKVLSHLTYEERVAAMELVNVSSLMTTAQMAEYLENVQREYPRLEFPQ